MAKNPTDIGTETGKSGKKPTVCFCNTYLMSSGGKVGCSRSTVLIKSWIRSSNSPKFVSILNVRSHLLWIEFTDPKINMVIIDYCSEIC